MSINEKLLSIQQELKAPKNQYNKYGDFNYRNCEDILEAVKPLCEKNKTVLTISDKIVPINSRFYVEATARLTDLEDPAAFIEVQSYAREEESKKGMDGSQVTGAASSYARKYALNGMFCIDDEKDADFDRGSVNNNSKGNDASKAKNSSQTRNNAPAKHAEKPQLPPTDKDGYWHCADCNEIIKNATMKDGNKILPNELVVLSTKKYGRCLCADCMKKAQAAKAAAQDQHAATA